VDKTSKEAVEAAGPAGGIAAFAAAAARRITKGSSEAKAADVANPAGGSVAFTAAAARRKENQSSEAKEADNAGPAGGIAALAAAAARHKEKDSSETKGVENAIPAGGIAAFAAAAARRKSQDSAKALGKAPEIRSNSPASGVDASEKDSSGEKYAKKASPVGGIAAAAAARSKNESTETIATGDITSAGGIAAFPAGAARLKTKGSTETQGDLDTQPDPTLAQSRSWENYKSSSDVPSSATPARDTWEMEKSAGAREQSSGTKDANLSGGIAAFAAATARRKVGDSGEANHEKIENVYCEPGEATNGESNCLSGAGGPSAKSLDSSGKTEIDGPVEAAANLVSLTGSEPNPSEAQPREVLSEKNSRSTKVAAQTQVSLAEEPARKAAAASDVSGENQHLHDQERSDNTAEAASTVEKDPPSTDKTSQDSAPLETKGRNEALVSGKPAVDALESKIEEMSSSVNAAEPETPQGVGKTDDSGFALHDREQGSGESGSNRLCQDESQPETTSEENQGKDQSQDPPKVSEETPQNASKKSGFAAQAAAYRKRKVRKEDKDLGEKEFSTDSGMLQNPENRAYDAILSNGDVVVGDLMPGNENCNSDDSKEVPMHGDIQFFNREEQVETVPNVYGSMDNALGNWRTASHQIDESRRAQPASPNRGPDLASFLEGGSIQSNRLELLRHNLDDSSVAMLAENLQKQPLDSRMSSTWTEGDTIPNWMTWADQVIKSSDTESVHGFEMSRDLNDLNDHDDDSTIATFNDDMSIMSASTPGRISSYISFENGADPGNLISSLPLDDDDMDPVLAITPAKVAASILFEDSSASSADQTPSKSNVHRGRDQDLVDMGLSFAIGEVGLDAGLSFGAGDVGLDDGLGFGGEYGGDGFGLGGDDNLDPGSQDKRKNWFPWAK
jgi:hypothetical protein